MYWFLRFKYVLHFYYKNFEKNRKNTVFDAINFKKTNVKKKRAKTFSAREIFYEMYNKWNKICIDFSSLVLSTTSIKILQYVEGIARSRHSHIVSRSGAHRATFFQDGKYFCRRRKIVGNWEAWERKLAVFRNYSFRRGPSHFPFFSHARCPWFSFNYILGAVRNSRFDQWRYSELVLVEAPIWRRTLHYLLFLFLM